MRTVPVTPGMPCWFELTTRDAARAAEFHARLSGLTSQAIPMDGFEYTILSAGEHAVMGIMPMTGPHWPADLPSHWMIYFAVEDADASLAKAKSLGGSACGAPMDIPIGRMAIVNDPSGAVFTLFRAAPGKTDGTNPVGEGAFVWCELGVAEPSSLVRFYGSLFGWHGEERRDEGFNYSEMHASSGAAIASIFKECAAADEAPKTTSPPKARPAWRPYRQVADVARAFDRAIDLGARAEWAPMEVPRMGRFAGIIDPCGAPLTLLQPKSGWNE